MESEAKAVPSEQDLLDESRQRNNQLKKDVAQLENDLRLAAEIGKQLLTTNQDLTQQLENVSHDYAKKIELLEQERHESQLWREQKRQQDKDRDEELEYLRARYESQREHFEMHEQAEHVATVNKLKKQVVTLQSELEQGTLMIAHLEEKARESEQRAQSLQLELTERINGMNVTCSEELAQLEADVNYLRAQKWELETQLSASHRETEQHNLSLARAQSEVASLRKDLEEEQCQATNYFNALERSREEVQELKVELDVIRMETQDHKRKGNSLFGELEDKRVAAEKKLITMKVQNEALRKQYAMTKETLNKFKLQMAALLQMSTGRADAQHVEKLQEQLYDAHNEVDVLTKKLAVHTTTKASMEGIESWERLLDQHGDEFSQYVKALLKKKDGEISRVKEEVSEQQMQVMSRTQQVLEYERKVYGLEQEKERLLGLAMKQRLRIDELTIKYEPENHKDVRLPTLKPEKLPDHAFRSKKSEAPPTDEKENKPKAPPRPLDVPDHIKATLHEEIIKDTVPSAAVMSPEAFPMPYRQTNMSAATAAPVSLTVLQGKPVKKATFSDNVDVVEIEPLPETDDTAGEGRRRVKGSTLLKPKVIKIKSTPAQGTGDCKMQ